MPTASIREDRGDILLDCQLYEADLVREVPGARYSGKPEPVWHLPLSWATVVTLRGVFGPRLQVAPNLAAWGRARREKVARAEALRDRLSGPPLFEDAAAAFPWVTAGAWWVLEEGSGLELTGVGGGKTIEFVLAARYRTEVEGCPDPHLVVTTPSMVRTWQLETEKWWPGVRVERLDGNAKQRREALARPADVYVTHWPLLPKLSRLAPYGSTRLERCTGCGGKRVPASCEVHDKELQRPWGMVIADEVHNGKKPAGKWSRSLWAVGRSARWRWGLTATPVDTRPDELWSLLHFVDPEEWPDHERYVSRWCETSWDGYGVSIDGLKESTRAEFDRIVTHRWRRVPKEVVRQGRPEPSHQVRLLDMPAAQARQYTQMAKGMVAEVQGGGQLVALDPLSKVSRLWQLASSALDVGGAPVLPSAKVAALLELVDEAAGEPLVVFAMHTRLLLLVEAALPEGMAAGMHGRVPRDLRDHHLERFQAGKIPVLLTQYKAGGEGLTLTRSHLVVTLQESWSALDNTQAPGRVDRPGQAQPVEVIHLRTAGTIDLAVPRVAAVKEGYLEDLVRDRTAYERLLRNELDWLPET